MRKRNAHGWATALVAALTIAATAGTASASSITLSDGDFADVTFHFFHPAEATVSGSVSASAGNPGAAIKNVITWSASSTLFAGFGALDNALTYDPSTQGAITSLDISLQKKLTVQSGTTPPQSPGRLLLEQGGNYYLYTTAPIATVPGYMSYNTGSLTAADFQQICLESCGPGHYANTSNLGPDSPVPLNFVNGSEITFGLLAFGGYNGGQSTVFYDNLNVQIAAVATPLPSTWALMLSGFLGLGFFAFRGTQRSAAAMIAG